MEPKKMSMNTSMKNAKIFEEDSILDNYEYMSYETYLQDKRLKENNIAENDNISSRVAEMGLKTPIKAEEEIADPSGQINVKRALLKQRSFPYSKDKDDRVLRKTPQKRQSAETISESVSKVIKMSKDTNAKQNSELDEDVLNRRQKQIDFGKNTIGYDNYIRLVPKDKRRPEDPLTPNKNRVYSRRGFDGLIKQWRLKLHKYDDSEESTNPE